MRNGLRWGSGDDVAETGVALVSAGGGVACMGIAAMNGCSYKRVYRT